jgi:hypothetical protein
MPLAVDTKTFVVILGFLTVTGAHGELRSRNNVG